MKALRTFTFAAIIAMAAFPAFAAQTAPATEGAQAAATPVECGKTMKRHNHGAERGLGTDAATVPCASESAASASAKAKKAPVHDHAKFHKNQ